MIKKLCRFLLLAPLLTGCVSHISRPSSQICQPYNSQYATPKRIICRAPTPRCCRPCNNYYPCIDYVDKYDCEDF